MATIHALRRPAGRQQSVLLVDDFADARQMYAEYLRRSEFRPIEAGHTVEALARVHEADLIVTGIRVRGPFDGLELVRRVRAEDGPRRTPIIVLSADALEPAPSLARKAGCDVFLTKPCLPGVLVQQIRALLAWAAPARAASSAGTDGRSR
ncbi:MAG TPA: response regulator [Vicinamibacterales bacterium]|nr:response regulator [Vicinamibacterales bacterium]